MVRFLDSERGPALFVNSKPVERATFEIRREVLDVTSIPGREPDHSWFHIDQSGHYHAFNAAGELPTLDARYHTAYDQDDNEDYDVFVGWVCAICGAMVEPKYTAPKADAFKSYAPGRIEWGGTFVVRGMAPYLLEGEKVSIRLPEFKRFGIAMITGVKPDRRGPIEYTYEGIGELAERKSAS